MSTDTRNPRRHSRGIMPQFAEKILSGEKTTTIRPDAKDIREGDLITFWVGWRKKNPIYICTAEIVEEPAYIAIGNGTAIFGDGVDLGVEGLLDDFAENDGFLSFADMIAFFQTAYPPNKNREWSFEGKLITFGNIRVESERYLKK